MKKMLMTVALIAVALYTLTPKADVAPSYHLEWDYPENPDVLFSVYESNLFLVTNIGPWIDEDGNIKGMLTNIYYSWNNFTNYLGTTAEHKFGPIDVKSKQVGLLMVTATNIVTHLTSINYYESR